MAQVTLQVEAILFDLDGTLIDSTQGVLNAWKAFGERHPFKDALSWTDVANQTHGRRLVETLVQFCGIPDDGLTQAIQEFEDLVINYGGGPKVLPGAATLLEQLVVIAPDKWTIVTSSSKPYATAVIRKCGLPLPSKVIVTADDIAPGQGKPNPAPYLAGARRISDQDGFAMKCLVVEDAPSGLAAGKRAGAQTLAVCTNHTHEFLESRSGNERPDFIVEDLECIAVQASSTGGLLVTIDHRKSAPTASETVQE